MELTPDQLLKSLPSGLKPVYILHGEEALQITEISDAIRQSADAQGFNNRQLMMVSASFDWSNLAKASETLDLFSEKTLIDLRLPTGKPGIEGAKALTRFVEQQNSDRDLLMVTTGKLERDVFKARWYKTLAARAVVVNARPLTGTALSRWLTGRVHQQGLNISMEGIEWLAEVTEGNMLAARQEIEKLAMVHGSERIGLSELQQEVADNARYTIYQLADRALAGDRAGISRVVTVLRQEGVAEALVLWALTREVRWLNLYFAVGKTAGGVSQLMREQRISNAHFRLLENAASRLRPRQVEVMLRECARADRVLKGQERGDVWELLLTLAWRLAGLETLLTPSRPF